MDHRMERVNTLLREEISKVLSNDVNDPRLASFVSVTRVSASTDLRNAKVFVSVLGSEEDKRSTLEALESASGFIHRTLRPKLSLKNVPFLSFLLDESIERGAGLWDLIREVSPDGESRPEQEP